MSHDEISKNFSPYSYLCDIIYKSGRNLEIVHMLFEVTDTEENASSLSEVSSLHDDFDRVHLESSSSDEKTADDEVDPNIWNETEFMEDYGLIEEVTSA